MTPCPSSAELGLWLADGPTRADADFEAHVETCAPCQQKLERLTAGAHPPVSQLSASRVETGGDFLRRLGQEPLSNNQTVEDGPGPARPTVTAARDPQSSLEIQTLLRKRLRFFTAWNTVGFGIYAFVVFVVQMSADVIALYWATVAVNGGLAVLLFGRRTLSLTGLRWIEGVAFASTALMFTRMHLMYFTWEPASSWLTRAVSDEDYVITVVVTRGTSWIWFLLITAYGLLIPNTWRRCVAVVSVMAVWPVLLNASFALPDRPFTTRLTFVGESAINMTAAAALAIFGSYRIEALRRQASEARKLGPYQLGRRLGAGGMGEVYLAEHALLRRPCAVKLIRPERAGDPKNLQRFEREVQATVALSHPNIVEVFDYGRTEDGTFYYVMEYLPGLNLEELVRQHSPLPPGRILYLLRQVCAALKEAHAAGLIHRDIKPGNVLVCRRGGRADVAKLLDFGLVRSNVVNGDESHLTQEGAIAGTPAYMSPEQAACRELDGRSDLYSLGAVAYFLLTGRPPFVRDSAVETLAAHLGEPVVAPSQYRSDIPADLQALVLCCLEKDPARRFLGANEVARALAECRCAAEWSVEQATDWWRPYATERLP